MNNTTMPIEEQIINALLYSTNNINNAKTLLKQTPILNINYIDKAGNTILRSALKHFHEDGPEFVEIILGFKDLDVNQLTGEPGNVSQVTAMQYELRCQFWKGCAYLLRDPRTDLNTPSCTGSTIFSYISAYAGMGMTQLLLHIILSEKEYKLSDEGLNKFKEHSEKNNYFTWFPLASKIFLLSFSDRPAARQQAREMLEKYYNNDNEIQKFQPHLFPAQVPEIK